MRIIETKFKAFGLLWLLCFPLWVFTNCETEPIKPIDIFDPEDPEELIINGETASLPLDDICSSNSLFVNNERINTNELGFKIKGTIFSESELGPIAVTNGEFDLIRNATGKINSFEGYGTAQFPKAGFLNDALVMADIFGAQTKYASGSVFNSEEEGLQLPFADNACFFRFTLDPYPAFGADEAGGLAMIKNALFDYDQLYYDPTDPAIFFDGKMHEYDIKDKPQPSSKNGEPKRFRSKKSKTKATISDVRFGLSLNDRFVFSPLEFSDDLEETIGGTNFNQFSGGFYISGRMSLKKYPLILEGETVVYSQLGLANIFELGFDKALYTRGVNGKVFFGHELLSYLPLDLEIELGRATLQENIEIGNTFLRFAGEYDMDTNDFFERVIGAEATKFLPSVSRSGQMYVNIGEKLEEWEFYMMNQYELAVPGLSSGLQKQYFHFTPQMVELGAIMDLPFGLGGTEVKGELNSDGSFLLYGTIKGDIPFGNDVSLNGELTLEVSNEGAFLLGEVNLPGSLAGISVKGQITDQGISLEGEGDVDISFGGGGALRANLHLLASTNQGIFLDGFLQTPLQVAAVEVAGEVSARGLLLSGMINGMVDFGVTELQSNLTLNASTWEGAMLSGMIDVPLVVIGGDITVSGEILTANLFKLSGSSSAFLDFGIASAEAGVNLGFSEREIDIGASAEFCVIEICDTLGISFNPNWGNGSLSACVDFPIDGEICIDL
ncbi:MAG: hypothetical protein ACR2MX_19290 [Cyclobacteriaceae bacterium]